MAKELKESLNVIRETEIRGFPTSIPVGKKTLRFTADDGVLFITKGDEPLSAAATRVYGLFSSDKKLYPYASVISQKANAAILQGLGKGIPDDFRAEAKNVLKQHPSYKPIELKKGKERKKSDKKKKKTAASDGDGEGLRGVGLGALGVKAAPLSTCDLAKGTHHPAPWQLKDMLALVKLTRKELQGVYDVMVKKAAKGDPQYQSSFRMVTRAFIDAMGAWVPESVETYVSQAQMGSRGVYRSDVFMYNEMCALILNSVCKYRGDKGRFVATSKAAVFESAKKMHFSEDAEKKSSTAAGSDSDSAPDDNGDGVNSDSDDDNDGDGSDDSDSSDSS